MNIDRKKSLSMLFIFLILGSTVAFAILSTFNQPPEQSEVPMPDSFVIDYELSKEQRQFLLSRGATVIEFRYPFGCDFCVLQRNKLEWITQNSGEQIILQELVAGGIQQSNTTVTSLRGQKKLKNATLDELEESVCNKLVGELPIWCVVREL